MKDNSDETDTIKESNSVDTNDDIDDDISKDISDLEKSDDDTNNDYDMTMMMMTRRMMTLTVNCFKILHPKRSVIFVCYQYHTAMKCVKWVE